MNSCASISSPSGGDRDTISPRLDTSFPANLSVNFQSKTILLVFNEYLNLKNPNQQIVISPPVEEDLDINLKGREILINLPDNLLSNTTYTISFGSSITDFTEGNANKDFKYIFSTGDFIDSLKIKGYVNSSFNGEAKKEMLVSLYELHDTTQNGDSLPFLKIPSYYAYTDENGFYQMEYLKSGRFLLIAFDDPQGDFLLNTGIEEMAIFGDTLNTLKGDQQVFKLRSFIPEPPYKFYGARHKQKGLIVFNFNKPVSNVSITTLNDTNSITYTPNATKDTLYHWFEPNEADSAGFIVSSFGSLDTAKLYLREFDSPKFILSTRQKAFRSKDTISLNSNVPIKQIDSSLFVFISGTDTVQAEFSRVQSNQRIALLPPKKGKNLELKIPQGAVSSILETKNDSVSLSLNRLGKADLGNLDFTIVADSLVQCLFELYNDKDELVIQRVFTDSIALKLREYIPGEYKAILIKDEDKNRKWSTGNYFTKKQAEERIQFKETVEIRANWDLQLRWESSFRN
jgi:hypothetical protein